MKSRNSKELQKALLKKGFVQNPVKDHHKFFYLEIDGKKHNIYTYISHGNKVYSSNLMGKVKKQLKLNDSKKAEDFFDCPLTKEQYIDMLEEAGHL